MTLAEFFKHAEPLERPISRRNQGFADFKTGFGFPFKEQHAVAVLCGERGDGASCRPAADNYDVVGFRFLHLNTINPFRYRIAYLIFKALARFPSKPHRVV